MMNNNVKTATNCCGVTGNGNDNGYDFVMGVLWTLVSALMIMSYI